MLYFQPIVTRLFCETFPNFGKWFWPSWNEMKLDFQINDWNSKISIGKTEVLVISLACLAQLNPTLESVKLWSGIFNLDVLSTLLLFILMIDIWISKFLLVYYFVIGWNQRISKFPLHWLSKKLLYACTHRQEIEAFGLIKL